jgi:AbrB family looped-hinge helix DNA binding protein
MSVARSIVAVNRQGRLTLPVEIRRRLGIGEGAQLEVRVSGSAVELRPTTIIAAEDRWAYTPKALASIKRALADMKAGRVFEMTEEELLRSGRRRRRPR